MPSSSRQDLSTRHRFMPARRAACGPPVRPGRPAPR